MQEDFYRVSTKWIGDKYEATSKKFPDLKAYASSNQEAIEEFKKQAEKKEI